MRSKDGPGNPVPETYRRDPYLFQIWEVERVARISIDSLSQTHKERNSVHEVVRSTYTTFLTADGTRYFQIDTFGTAGREHPEKISQSIQLDAEAARTLIELLKRELFL